MTEFDLMLEKIDKVEYQAIEKNPEWFYHGFDAAFTEQILSEGILAKKYLDFPWPNFGLNGKHYISIAKDTNAPGNALNRYKTIGPLAIIDGIKVIKCRKYKPYQIFNHTRIPLRYTAWEDEYQVYGKIPKDNIIGIESMLYYWIEHQNTFYLKKFRNMLETMEKMGIDLPIYDYSREENDQIYEIDKKEYLNTFHI